MALANCVQHSGKKIPLTVIIRKLDSVLLNSLKMDSKNTTVRICFAANMLNTKNTHQLP